MKTEKGYTEHKLRQKQKHNDWDAVCRKVTQNLSNIQNFNRSIPTNSLTAVAHRLTGEFKQALVRASDT